MPRLASQLTAAFTSTVSHVAGRRLDAAPAAWLVAVPTLLLLVPAPIPGQPFWLGVPAFVAVALVARTVRAGPRAVAALLVLLAAGVALRLGLYGAGWSGVLAVTEAAIDRVGAGLSPWNVAYVESIPPGEPFPYGPAELAWYWPFAALGIDLRWVELAGSCGLLVALAARGRPIGLAVAALAPLLAMVASDGSNDTSAGIVLLMALLLAKRGPIRGGIGLAIAGAFKFHALAWAPGLILLGGLPALAALGLASLGIWAPALLLVGPGPILASLAWAESLHGQAGWSLAGFVQSIVGRTVASWPFTITRWAGGALMVGAVALDAWRRRPAPLSWGAFLAGGVAIFLVVLYGGYWATHGYLAQLAPILCWELDDLAGAQPVLRPSPRTSASISGRKAGPAISGRGTGGP
jgi:hypothetical protein